MQALTGSDLWLLYLPSGVRSA